jgi:hypothetical protein
LHVIEHVVLHDTSLGQSTLQTSALKNYAFLTPFTQKISNNMELTLSVEKKVRFVFRNSVALNFYWYTRKLIFGSYKRGCGNVDWLTFL